MNWPLHNEHCGVNDLVCSWWYSSYTQYARQFQIVSVCVCSRVYIMLIASVWTDSMTTLYYVRMCERLILPSFFTSKLLLDLPFYYDVCWNKNSEKTSWLLEISFINNKRSIHTHTHTCTQYLKEKSQQKCMKLMEARPVLLSNIRLTYCISIGGHSLFNDTWLIQANWKLKWKPIEKSSLGFLASTSSKWMCALLLFTSYTITINKVTSFLVVCMHFATTLEKQTSSSFFFHTNKPRNCRSLKCACARVFNAFECHAFSESILCNNMELWQKKRAKLVQLYYIYYLQNHDSFSCKSFVQFWNSWLICEKLGRKGSSTERARCSRSRR